MTRLPEHRERLKRTEAHTTITGKPLLRWHPAGHRNQAPDGDAAAPENFMPSRSRNAAADNGNPRSDVNRKGLAGFWSRFNRLREHSMSPWSRCVDGSLSLSLRMWIVPPPLGI